MKTTLDLMLDHRPELLSLDVAWRSRTAIGFARRGKVVHVALASGRLHGWGDSGYVPLDILPRRVNADIIVPHSPYRVSPGGAVHWHGRPRHLARGIGVYTDGEYRRTLPISSAALISGRRIIRPVADGIEYVTQLHAEGYSDHLILQDQPNYEGDYLALEFARAGRDNAKGCGTELPFARDAAGRRIICDVIRLPGMLLMAVPLSWLASARYPVDIDPDMTACLTCWAQGQDIVYATARADAQSALSSCTSANLGQNKVGSTYFVARQSFFFSSPCLVGTITGVTMDMAIDSRTGLVTDFDIQIADADFRASYGTGLAHSTTCGFGCTRCQGIYDDCIGAAAFVTWKNTAAALDDTYYTSPAMDATYANQNLNDYGAIYYCARSANDYNFSPPINSERVNLYCCNSASFTQVLHLTGDLADCSGDQAHVIPYGV